MPRHLHPSIVAALLAALASPPASAEQSSDGARGSLQEVVAIERAFSDDSVKLGVKRSFLKYAAADGIIFRPGPVPAVATISKDPDDDQGATLQWWPVMGTVSRSNDLALSVGPWVIHNPGTPPNELYGYYATVWKRQADGSWKFVIDGAGARLDGAATRSRDSAVKVLPTSTAAVMDGAEALKQVRETEERLSRRAQQAARVAIAAALAPRAWLMGSNVEPGVGPAPNDAELLRRPKKLSFTYRGGGASRAGDLVFTYGDVTSFDDAMPLRDATYLHVWQSGATGWQLLFEGIKSRR